MKHISSRIVAYTFFYCSVIFGIFVLQFTKGKTFSYKIGSLLVSGRHETTPEGEKLPLLPVHVISNGLDLYISEQNPILAITPEGASKILKVERYELTKTGFSIYCSEQVVFTFFSDSKGDIEVVYIEADIPEQFSQVMLPWQITQYASIEREKDKVLVRFNKKQYSFFGNFGIETAHAGITSTQQDIPRLVLEKTHAQAYYKTYLPSLALDIEAIASLPQASPAVYAKAVDSFGAAVLNAGKSFLYGEKSDKKLFAAYMAEMGRNGKLNTALEAISMQSLPKEMRSYLINPFYNHLEQTYPELARTETEKQQLYTQLLDTKQAAIFEQEALIPFVINKKNERLIEQLKSFTAALNPDILTVRQAAGMLSLYMDFAQYYPNEPNPFEKHTPPCEQKIKNSLFFIEENLYVSDDGKIIKSAETFAIAHILMRYAVLQTDLWQAVGRMLATSLLAYSSESATLPAYFKITEPKSGGRGIMIDDSNILNAGVLYPIVLPDTTWYPHIKSLALQAEPGIWAWTIARDIEVLEHTAKTLTLRIRFVKDEAHYLTLHGIKPFYRIELYGIPFRSDSRYAMYHSSGYRYNSDSKLLYLKMLHKAEYEVIKLSFEQAAPAASATPSTPASSVQQEIQTVTPAVEPVPDSKPEKTTEPLAEKPPLHVQEQQPLTDTTDYAKPE
ncbi:MAG: hypothetical protein ACTTJ7_07385 [Treponema sp.]